MASPDSGFGISALGTAGFRLGALLTAGRDGTANRLLFSKPVFSLLADTPAGSGHREEV
jgi:hypothetical protein